MAIGTYWSTSYDISNLYPEELTVTVTWAAPKHFVKVDKTAKKIIIDGNEGGRHYLRNGNTYVYVTLTPRIDLTLPHVHPTPLWHLEERKTDFS